ncbi:MAG: NADPH-dependent glutamate synthase [Candidatus Bathyarchaeota archaeon]|uniref:NADPH-dependent glutamate synthase n=1 Tax=Candidatus Bathycorpusculum sp. TaxID=2994959 RepID=UPI00281AD0C2|nr:NADPH-dependent glutamate synthase [Candidatus Termiticorpusculum sp.]MCL2292044.1 NADPH-dependent glutamate synthase [Candidatus Termiticorpusculum sp.]
MPKQEPRARINNFQEVVLGYSEEQALTEASRCLHCSNAQCIKGCPVGIDIPEFIKYITQKNYTAAIAKIKEKNSLPAICGRVCPQEEQCQKLCILGKKGDPVSIGRLERYVADFEQEKGIKTPKAAPSNGKKIAVIGAGPAGLTVAADLAKLGYTIELFEALHAAGGVLVYGIPEFRLPKSIVKAEVDYIEKLGVKLTPNALIGRLFTIDDLLTQRGFEAVFIGTGAGLPKFLKIPGENLNGVYSANEFLIRVNLMKAYRFPEYKTPLGIGKKVAVIGGGNVALDSARSAKRLGTEKVCLIYRRDKTEMPAREEEILNAEEEDIEFKFLTAPIKFVGNDEGRVKALEYLTMELSEPNASGRRKPVPIKGSETIMEVDTVILAIGRTPNPIIQSTTNGLKTMTGGIIIVDKNTGQTSLEAVYAGGDIATGEATVISAMESGKIAAKSIHEYLSKKQ